MNYKVLPFLVVEQLYISLEYSKIGHIFRHFYTQHPTSSNKLSKVDEVERSLTFFNGAAEKPHHAC